MAETPTQRRARTQQPTAHPAQPEGYVCPLSGDFVDKLESLLVGQERNDRTLEALGEKVDKLEENNVELESKVGEVYRAIRGQNGTPGMVTDITLLKEQISNLSNRLATTSVDEHDREEEKPKEAPVSSAVAFKEWVLDKALIPIVTAVVIWLLVTVLPNLLVHINASK